jgi:SAM-dependent methyltransferase
MSAGDVELYDRTRLELPAPLVRALLERIPLGPDRRLLQVGAGTGRTTWLLVVTRNDITALEPDRRRAKHARDLLALHHNVKVVAAELGSWPAPERLFDTVLAFTGDLTDPVVRVDKAAEVLRPGGLLVLIYVRQIAGGDDQFLADAHEYRRQLDPGTEPSFPLPTADQLARRSDISGSGRFKEPRVRRRRWDVTYSASQYVDVEMTDAHIRALPEPTRADYLDGVATLVRKRYGGRVTMRYLFEMQTAERRRRVRVRPRAGGAGSGGRSTTTGS